MVRNFDEVLKILLLSAGRNKQLVGVRLAALRSRLAEAIECIDQSG